MSLSKQKNYLHKIFDSLAKKADVEIEPVDEDSYLVLYDLYADQLPDDVSWSFNFYVVATDQEGNMSEPEKVTFQTSASLYANDCSE